MMERIKEWSIIKMCLGWSDMPLHLVAVFVPFCSLPISIVFLVSHTKCWLINQQWYSGSWKLGFLKGISDCVSSLQVPSMRQLHLHVISQDFDSKNLKNKKHWNSFNTAFFLDSVDVLEEVSSHGKATLRDDESLLSMELRCHRCRSAHPNIPRLKSHISNCQAPFPPSLLQNSRLVLAPCNAGIDP